MYFVDFNAEVSPDKSFAGHIEEQTQSKSTNCSKPPWSACVDFLTRTAPRYMPFFQAMYLPWVLFAFNMIIAGGGIMELIGILIGHMYFFLMFKYPQDFGGPSLLSTPQFMYNWFPNQASLSIHRASQFVNSDTKLMRL